MLKNFHNVYQFKISLEVIEPKIWRKIEVPETYSFWDLHIAIQDAMGWLDDHLHQFNIIDPKSGERTFIGIPNNSEVKTEFLVLPGWEIFISDFFALNTKAVYEYDFGDGWQHSVSLEKILPVDLKIKYPICVNGEMACPPENCGGYYGYENLLKTIKDPNHEEYQNKLNLLGDNFNPELFDPSNVKFNDPKKRLIIAMNINLITY